MEYLDSLLAEMIADGHVDKVVLTPTDRDMLDAGAAIWIYGGNDALRLAGIPQTDLEIEAPLLVRMWGVADDNLALNLEELVARVRDKIVGAVEANSFSALDPPVEVLSLDLIDDPNYDIQRDFSEATLAVRVRNAD